MIKFAIAQSRIYQSPGVNPVGTIQLGEWCEVLTDTSGSPIQTQIPFSGLASTLWTRVRYGNLTGWCYDPKLEELTFVFPQDVVGIAHPTLAQFDLKQYILLDNGRTLYNGCGEFCVAYIAGLSIDDFFVRWRVKSPAWYSRIVPANRTTGIVDLNDMLSAVGYDQPGLEWVKALYDPLLNRALISPDRMRSLLNDHYLIAGVKIDYLGRISGGGVGHWVVVESVDANGINSGFIKLYNPATNAIEMYSWKELISSSPEVYGLFVERKK